MSKLAVTIEGYTFEIELASLSERSLPNGGSQITVSVDGEPVEVVLPENFTPGEDVEWLIVNDHPYEVMLASDSSWMRSRWGIHSLEIHDLELSTERPRVGDGRVKAPIPGQITQVMVSVGQEVSSGQPLLILEAMKMANEIRAPRSGVIKSLNVALGQSVILREVLLEID